MGNKDSGDLDGALKLILLRLEQFDRFTGRFLKRIDEQGASEAVLRALFRNWHAEALGQRKAISDAWIRIYWLQWNRNPVAAKQWLDAGITVRAAEQSLDPLILAVKRRVTLLRAMETVRNLPAWTRQCPKPPKRQTTQRRSSPP
jgi:hypothetical protein